MTTLTSAAFSAVSTNEVSGNSATADSILPPLGSGTSGWTIGFNQEDFNTNSAEAQATLKAALTASGNFNSANATSIAVALTAAGTSSTINLSGITDIHGNAATVASINAALQTTAGSNSVSQSSLNDFTSSFNSLNTMLGSASLLAAVQSALADPTQGPLLQIVLADYNNQYGIETGGNMMTLLTTGSVTLQNGTVVPLNTTTAATVAQSVMTLALDTQWVASGFGDQACDRLATDVAAAAAYDSAVGVALPGSETITSAYGQCAIDPGATSTGFTGTWTNGSVSGSSSGTVGSNPLDVSGTVNTIDMNGATIDMAAATQATVDGANNAVSVAAGSALTIGGSGNTATEAGNTSQPSGTTVYVAGPQENVDFSYTSVVIESNEQATTNGTGNTITVDNGASATVTGSANAVNMTGTNSTVTDSSTGDTITDGGSGNSLSVTGANTGTTVTGSSDNATVSGSGDNVTVNSGTSNDGITINSSNESSTINGSGNSVTIGSGVTNDGVTMNSSNANIVDNGSASVTIGSGATNVGLTMNGSNASIVDNGNDSVTIGSGATNVGLTMNGSNASIVDNGNDSVTIGSGVTNVGLTMNGSNASIVDNGSASVSVGSGATNVGITMNGTNASLADDGNNVSVTVGSTASGLGIFMEGINENVTDYGGANLDVTGSNIGTWLMGNHETAVLTDSRESAAIEGDNDGADIDASNTDATLLKTDTGSWLSGALTAGGETVDMSSSVASNGSISYSESGSGNYRFSGSGSLSATNYYLENDGTYYGDLANLTAGGSQIGFFNEGGGVADELRNFSGSGATGTESTATINLTDGLTIDVSYGAGGAFLSRYYTGSTYDGIAAYLANGTFEGGDSEYASDGGFGASADDDGGGEGGGGGYGYGGGYELAKGAQTTGTNIGTIAQYDTGANAPGAAQAAEGAQFEISVLSQLEPPSSITADMSLFEGVKWNSKVITWSLADSPGTTGSPFSSYMGSQYAALVQQAFQAWGAASGLTFQEVADSSSSDIRLGFGDFDTASSGVVGYTGYSYNAGQLQPNVIIRLEDPSQDALATTGAGVSDSSTYSGTQADLYQVILHEIGHALGLADNADPNSVMYYQSGTNGGTLDSSDIAGIQSIYNPAPLSPAEQTALSALSTASMTSDAFISSALQQLVQASASIPAAPPAMTSLAPTIASTTPTLAASQHA